jgi:predicted ArsR family transcriptional regulator
MKMKTTVHIDQFRQAFDDQEREDNFTYEGLGLLFDYFEQLEDDLGEEIELDVIAICCEFSEDTPEEIADAYGIDLSDCDDDEEKMEAVVKYLEDKTSVAGETDSTIVYRQF